MEKVFFINQSTVENITSTWTGNSEWKPSEKNHRNGELL